MMWLIRHSHTDTYFASISPSPACSMISGAVARMSVSARIASGQALYRLTFSRFWIMLAELEQYPSMLGAVQTTMLGSLQAWAATLQQSLITPLPMATITSHRGSSAIVSAPTARSSGSILPSVSGNTNSLQATPAFSSVSRTRLPAAFSVFLSITSIGLRRPRFSSASGSLFTAPGPAWKYRSPHL